MQALGFLMPAAAALALTSTLLLVRRGGGGLMPGILLVIAVVTVFEVFSSISPTLGSIAQSDIAIFRRFNLF
ncbi:MAG: hypothetical protein JNK67_03055 [Alphaproteobacteria bacterium]|nr:hypothetical protein [Alphaproteobacteria bacterium]